MNQPTANNIRLLFLLGLLSFLIIYCANKLHIGQQVIFLLVLIFNCGAYWYASDIVLSLYDVKAATPDQHPMLFATVAYLSERANIPMPAIYVLAARYPNSFTVGRNTLKASIVVTSGLLRILDKEELGAVIAHEIAHIKQKDILLSTLGASLNGVINYAAKFALSILQFIKGQKPFDQGENIFKSFLMSSLGPFLALLIQITIPRSRVYAADQTGAELCHNPRALINALRKIERDQHYYALEKAERNPVTAHLFIYSPLGGRQWGQLFSTHPPIEERILRLEMI